MLALKKPDRSRWDDRKLDHVRPYLDAAERDGRFGVVAIVVAQEFQWVFSATKRTGAGGGIWFDFAKAERRVGIYYFYVLDPEFGPGFIKICTYFPYPAKVWLNGHEWAKRQADHAGIGYTALANGFATCDRPRRAAGDLRPVRARRRAGVLRPLDRRHPDPVHRRRPGRRLLVGAVDAPSRGVHAPWCSTTPAGPAGSSKRSSPTTSPSAAPKRVDVVFGPTGRGRHHQAAVLRPACSPPAPR